jgi:dihydroorotate dehydrogenase electron transfer subunit
MTGPLHVTGEVLAARRVGAYRELSLVVPGIGERSRPGSFVALSVGGGHLARRAMWIRRVVGRGGHPAVVEIVVERRGAGTRALARLQPGERVAVTGPLGRPFALPRERAACLLVGEGYAAAALTLLAERLRERGCPVRLLLGGDDDEHVLGALEARRTVGRLEVVGRELAAAVAPAAAESEVVYAAASLPVLRACADSSAALGITCQVALERPLTCATGLCRGCPVPVLDGGGDAHLVRDCIDGPVFRADRVDWEAIA